MLQFKIYCLHCSCLNASITKNSFPSYVINLVFLPSRYHVQPLKVVYCCVVWCLCTDLLPCFSSCVGKMWVVSSRMCSRRSAPSWPSRTCSSRLRLSSSSPRRRLWRLILSRFSWWRPARRCSRWLSSWECRRISLSGGGGGGEGEGGGRWGRRRGGTWMFIFSYMNCDCFLIYFENELPPFASCWSTHQSSPPHCPKWSPPSAAWSSFYMTSSSISGTNTKINFVLHPQSRFTERSRHLTE